jgi:RimJ/RimL family protein N-acetyltransferase
VGHDPGVSVAPPANLDLLRIQAEMSLDARGRVRNVCGITIAIASRGVHAAWVGASIDDGIAQQLAHAASQLPAALDPQAPQAQLEPLRRILETSIGAPSTLSGGPAYVFDSVPTFAAQTRIARSDAHGADHVRDANPGNWHAIEWQELVDGRLGPWAMSLDAGRAVSIAHTALPMTPRAAECGVWTHEAHRRRGHATATVAAWADILRPSNRFLFYATDAGNIASQRVAARLRLREIGWIWRIEPADAAPPRRHPLSRPG